MGIAPFIKRVFPSLGESEDLGTNSAMSEAGLFSCRLTLMGILTSGSRYNADSLTHLLK